MPILSTFRNVKEAKIDLSKVDLSNLPCGLFRAPLEQAEQLLPELKELYDSVPVTNPKEWEIDVKIHMLMKDQYPCIPNWHCDYVPRVDGKLRYDLVDLTNPPMYLWVSDEPTTEFIDANYSVEGLKDHGDIAKIINEYGIGTVKIPSQTWISMNQLTAHRGTKAQRYGWRIFARLVHNSMVPQRPLNSFIRRHCQVYLDAETFTW